MRRGKGEGTKAYRQKDGRWRAELVIGWKPDGRPVKKYVYAGSEALCNRRLRQLLNDRDAGILTAGRAPLLDEWLSYWLDNIAAHSVDPGTVNGYRGMVRNHVAGSAAARVRLDKLTPEHLDSVYSGMRGKGLSETTVLLMHRVLSRALKVAVQRGRLAVNPAGRLDAPKAAPFDPGLLSVEDARALIRAAEGMEGGARWILGLSLGLRQGEVLALGWDAFDAEAGTLRVFRSLRRLPWRHGCPGKGGAPSCGRVAKSCPDRHGGGLFLKWPKSEAGKRTLALPAQLVDALVAHRAAQDAVLVEEGRSRPDYWTAGDGEEVDLIFCQRSGAAVDRRRDWGAWKAFLKEAGVPPVRVHDARHTAATVLLVMGVPGRVVMDIMGWSQVSMLNRYQHVVDELKRSAADAVGSALWRDSGPVQPTPDRNEGGLVSLDEFRRRRKA